MSSYNEMFARNYGYVDEKTQKKISEVTILIAGCGLGSYSAEALVRLGCTKFILVDHDTVDVHNLNRQSYIYEDIGHYKCDRLRQRMQSINPAIHVECVNSPVSEINAEELVSRTDFILDTIDFLSVKGLIALYEQCYLQGKPVISALNAGWGAVAFYVPAVNQTKNWFKEIFKVSSYESDEPREYAHYYKQLVQKISPNLPEEVSTHIIRVFDLMAENKPCPASQLSAGSFAAASLCTTILYRVVANKDVASLPYAMALDMSSVALNPAFPFT